MIDKDRFTYMFGLIKRADIWGYDEFGEYSLYMSKYRFSFSKRLLLHVFHRGDGLDPPHDHPWDFWTFPLVSYFEEVGVTNPHRQLVSCGQVHARKAEYVHRVIEGHLEARQRIWGVLYDEADEDRSHCSHWDVPWLTVLAWKLFGVGKIITAVWLSEPRREWGFYVPYGKGFVWVPWKQYLSREKNWTQRD